MASSSPLLSATTATCVRVRNGHAQVTDGPFAETAEQLGGYYVIDVDDQEEAIAIASRLPAVTKGTVEIRPLLPLPDSLSLPDAAACHQATANAESPRDYIILMYAEANAWPPEHTPALAESVELCHELHRRGRFCFGRSPSTTGNRDLRAASQRNSNNRRWSIYRNERATRRLFPDPDSRSLDEVIAVASRIPGSRRGTAEIRPLFPLPER